MILAAALAPSEARACAACGCGDPTLTAMGVEKPYRNRVRLALDQFYGELSTGTGASTETTRTFRWALTGNWSPHPRITLTASFPLYATWLSTPSQTATLFGPGDAEASARFVAWRDRTFSPRDLLNLLVGLKAPTAPRLRDDRGYPYAGDIQPGSGSWDPFAGATWAHFAGNLALFASLAFRYTTPGWRGYTRGMSLGWSTGAQFQPWSFGALAISVDGHWSDADHLPSGAPVSDTGGTMLAVTPALLVTPASNWLLRLAVQVHAFDWLNGVQSTSSSVFLSTVIDLN